MARRKNPETDTPSDPSTNDLPESMPESMAEPEPVNDAVTAALADPEPLPPPTRPESPPVAEVRQQSGILGPLLGGALAAVAGFALSHYNAFGLATADSSAALASLEGRLSELEAAPKAPTVDLSGLESGLAALETRVTALEDAPPPPAPDLSALDERLAAIEAMPSSGDASTAALAAKLADLERRLAALPREGVDTAKVDAALARLEAAEAEATARATAAAEAAAAAERAMALGRLRAAATSGTAFDAELAALGDADLTAALAPHAAGVATTEALQADFPDLVRQALDVARTAEGDRGWGARVMDFLASQTGARPLAPQDGTTPEAILSRADFAVTEGRLADALTEITSLPPEIQAVFAGWTGRATARLAVDTALEAQ
jgi:hypothetical protein